jgi:hypothetical protein
MLRDGQSHSFVVCDKRDDINRVAIAPEQLTQWQCRAELIARSIATSLSLNFSGRRIENGELLEVGMLTGRKRAQMLCLGHKPQLVLLAATNRVPVADVLQFESGQYVIDKELLRRLVDTAAAGDPRHTPSVARLEARKLKTEAIYEEWRKAYRKLKRRRPGRSDVWYSQQIARMEIANHRSPETIRKHMKR